MRGLKILRAASVATAALVGVTSYLGSLEANCSGPRCFLANPAEINPRDPIDMALAALAPLVADIQGEVVEVRIGDGWASRAEAVGWVIVVRWSGGPSLGEVAARVPSFERGSVVLQHEMWVIGKWRL